MKTIAAVALCLVLVGCVTGDKFRQLSTGLDRAAVEKKLGKPDGYAQIDGAEVLTYQNRLMSGSSWDRTDYQVILKDGKVVQYGPGEVRQAQNNAGVLIVAPTQ